jgi:hypothetical protein
VLGARSRFATLPVVNRKPRHANEFSQGVGGQTQAFTLRCKSFGAESWRTWDCVILLRRALLALDRLGRALQLLLHNGHLPLQNGNVSAGLAEALFKALV